MGILVTSDPRRIPGRDRYTENLRSMRDMRLVSENSVDGVENLIKTVEVPLELVGPLLFRGTHITGSVYAPLATVKDEFVTVISRGATAISRSGGVRTHAVPQQTMQLGMRVVAEADLDPEVLVQVLDVDAYRLLDTHHGRDPESTSCVAAVVGSIFTALGQNIASAYESSRSHLELAFVDERVHATLVIPALKVTTTGGGTALPTQHALLDLLECHTTGSCPRLAEIIAGFALAQALSILSSSVPSTNIRETTTLTLH